MPELSWLIVIVGALGNFVIGLTTYLRATKSATSQWFGMFSFLFAAYLIINQLSIVQNDDSSTLFWIRIVMMIAPAIIFSFFVLVNVFPKEKMSLSRKVFFGSLVATIVMVVLGSTSLIFSNVVPGTNQPIPGKLVFLFLIYNVLFLSWSTFILIKKFRAAFGLEKTQLRFFLFGAIAMFSLILLSNVVLVILFNTSSFVVFVPIYTLVFVGLTSYAIIRHELFNIKVFATQAITVILWIILFSKIFVAQTSSQIIVDSLIFATALVFGILLIKSVGREVKQREKLQELTEKLQALDKQKDEFISMAAHELRAPMTAIKGYVSMILDGDVGEIPDKARDYLTDVTSVNERLIRLVNNMLNVSRIEEGRLIYKTEVVKLSDIAKSVYTSFKFEAERKDLKFIFNFSEDVRDTVKVDADRLNEIIGNFVSNAVKYTETGSIEINITASRDGFVRLGVKDTGPGISKTEQNKLFQKFFRVASTAGKTIGTGLGLYISKLLVEKFGGTIGIISESGQGSEFWFELPIATNNLDESKPNELA